VSRAAAASLCSPKFVAPRRIRSEFPPAPRHCDSNLEDLQPKHAPRRVDVPLGAYSAHVLGSGGTSCTFSTDILRWDHSAAAAKSQPAIPLLEHRQIARVCVKRKCQGPNIGAVTSPTQPFSGTSTKSACRRKYHSALTGRTVLLLGLSVLDSVS